MKKLLILLFLTTSTICLSQTKKTLKSGDVDKRVVFRLDSLSKKYKKDIVGYMVRTTNGKSYRYITYYKNDELFREEITN